MSHAESSAEPARGAGAGADRRYLCAALALIAGFMVVEVILGLVAGSLALISDAGHMLTDAASLGLALVAMNLAARPARGRLTYGYKRAEILSAQANGITLLVLVGWFGYEAVRRLIVPPAVTGQLVVITAGAGVAVNLVVAALVGRANRTSLNVRGVFAHVVNDLWAFVATAVSGAVVLLTGFTRADAIATLIVATLMAKAGIGLVRDSWRIFLEAAPAGLDPDRIGADLAGVSKVSEVHDLHVWTITSGYPALSAHVLVTPGVDCHEVREHLEAKLRDRYGIEHTTLQVDHAAPELLALGSSDGSGHCRPEHGGAVHRPPTH